MDKDEIRLLYELKLKYGCEIPKTIKRRMRREWARSTDKLEESIQENWRRLYPREDGEYWYDYCIFEDGGESDEKIQQYVDSLQVHNYTPYDCSGKPVTRWLHWKRVAAGIVIIHELALDI